MICDRVQTAAGLPGGVTCGVAQTIVGLPGACLAVWHIGSGVAGGVLCDAAFCAVDCVAVVKGRCLLR